MNPFFTLNLFSVIIFSFLTIIFFFSKRKLEVFFSILAIPVPIYVGDSVHKIIYPADIVGLICLLAVVRLALEKKLILNYPLFYLIVAILVIPVIGTGMQFLFASSINATYSIIFFLRAFFGVSIMVLLYNLFAALKIDPHHLFLMMAINFLIVLFFGAGQFLGLYNTDILSVIGTTASITDWNGGFGGGVVGIYRGEFGGFAAVLCSMVLPFVLVRLWGYFFYLLIIVGSVYVCLGVGSRQGVLGIFIALMLMVCSGVVKKETKTIYISVLVVIVLISSFSYIAYMDPQFYEWIFERFEVFGLGVNSALEAASYRDDRIPKIIDKLLYGFEYYVIGTGYGNFSPFVESDFWIMTYVDSDFLWGMQQIGVVGMIFYVYFLLISLRASVFLLINANYCVGGASIAIAFVSCYLVYGHYVVMNPGSSHVPTYMLHFFGYAFIFANYDACKSVSSPVKQTADSQSLRRLW